MWLPFCATLMRLRTILWRCPSGHVSSYSHARYTTCGVCSRAVATCCRCLLARSCAVVPAPPLCPCNARTWPCMYLYIIVQAALAMNRIDQSWTRLRVHMRVLQLTTPIHMTTFGTAALTTTNQYIAILSRDRDPDTAQQPSNGLQTF